MHYCADGMISNSHLTHRLLTYALLHFPQRQLALALDLFTAYHSDGIHPADIPTLAQLAAKHEIFSSPLDAEAWLEGSELDVEVKRAYVTARRLGVTGVPFFVFQDRWAASGAMGVEEFVQLLEDISRREGGGSSITPSPTSTAASPNSGEALGKGSPKSPQDTDGPGLKGISCERDT